MPTVILETVLKYKIPLCPPPKTNFKKQIKNLELSDPELYVILEVKAAEAKDLKPEKSFWLTKVWLSRFMCQYNLDHDMTSTTMYSKRELFQQLVPSLEFVFALRKAFGVPVGVGRILNADESMSFKFDSKSKSWTC